MEDIPAEQQVLHVRLYSATQPLWEGEAISLSSVNSDGPFDILPMHANFISLIKGAPIAIVKPSGEKQTWNFDQAVVSVKENEIKVYADFLKNIVQTR